MEGDQCREEGVLLALSGSPLPASKSTKLLTSLATPLPGWEHRSRSRMAARVSTRGHPCRANSHSAAERAPSLPR